MGEFDLALVVCQQKGAGSLKHAEAAALKTGSVFAGANAFTTGFDPDHSHRFIAEKWMEKADCIAATSDAGQEQIRQSVFALEDLAPGFHANDALKIPHHLRVGMRS